jgi:hypothetical protein
MQIVWIARRAGISGKMRCLTTLATVATRLFLSACSPMPGRKIPRQPGQRLAVSTSPGGPSPEANPWPALPPLNGASAPTRTATGPARDGRGAREASSARVATPLGTAWRTPDRHLPSEPSYRTICRNLSSQSDVGCQEAGHDALGSCPCRWCVPCWLPQSRLPVSTCETLRGCVLATPPARGQAAEACRGKLRSDASLSAILDQDTKTPEVFCLFVLSIIKRAANHSLVQPQNSLCHHPRPSCDGPRWGQPCWCGG